MINDEGLQAELLQTIEMRINQTRAKKLDTYVQLILFINVFYRYSFILSFTVNIASVCSSGIVHSVLLCIPDLNMWPL